MKQILVITVGLNKIPFRYTNYIYIILQIQQLTKDKILFRASWPNIAVKMSLEKEEIKLLQDSWNEVCAQSKEITQVGVELFIR